MRQETFSQSLTKLILTSAFIVFVGALFGAIMYLAINYSAPVKVPEIVRLPDKEMIKAEAQKYLPKDYSVLSDNFLYYENVDNDKAKEIIVAAKKKDELTESLFILKQGMLGYSIAKQFAVAEGNYFEDVLVKNINGNKIPEVVYVYAIGSGETLPRTVQIYEWDGIEYKSLLVKNMTLLYIGRPEAKNWSKGFIRDLNKDGKTEVIIPEVGVYQAYCGNSGECASLLKLTVYKWDGEKYLEATDEFSEVYSDEIKLANSFLNNSTATEDNKKAINEYLEEIIKLTE